VTELFSSDDLGSHLARIAGRAEQELFRYDADELLLAAETDVVDYLIRLGTVEELVLHRGEARQLDPIEIIKPSQAPGRPDQLVTRWSLVVPFSGDRDLFVMRASTRTLNPPHASVDVQELRLDWDDCGGESTGPQIRSYFDGELDRIDKCIGFTNVDIDQHNTALAGGVPDRVAQRRAKHLADKQLQADLGYPIRSRRDAAAYAVPLNRRRIAPTPRPVRPPTGTQPFAPEPVLAEADYEAALKVLLNGRNALERSPSIAAKASEEQIRDLLLFFLNGQFEGKAAGEVFNFKGKTDHLIREGDRNVFIGECKIWHGPKTVADALDQLLRYLVWRDTKAALLLFIRGGDVTSITKKAIARVREHPNYKRDGTHATEDRHDFVVHANGDPAREIHLALLPFLVPATTP
jgi:hypothetical protein